jgi:hypothetical protein
MAFVHGATCEEHVTDQVILLDLIARHVGPDPYILDATWGSGSIWQGLPWYPQERLDSRPMPNVTCVGDFLHMPSEWTARFNLVVWDPPHDTERGKRSRYASRFGATEPSVQHALSIAHLFRPFLVEAHRVLNKQGVILVKVMDGVHRGKLNYVIADFILAVRNQSGLRECDRRLKVESRAATMDNWQGKQIHHSRTDYVYWIVVKKGLPC